MPVKKKTNNQLILMNYIYSSQIHKTISSIAK